MNNNKILPQVTAQEMFFGAANNSAEQTFFIDPNRMNTMVGANAYNGPVIPQDGIENGFTNWAQLLNYGMSEMPMSYRIINWVIRIVIGSVCLVIGIIMQQSKRFKQHPYRLYGMELLLLATYTLNISRFIIDFDL